jgi:glyoxylase-like metal-dependent hydrolase (beta-lactamase superfamily II)
MLIAPDVYFYCFECSETFGPPGEFSSNAVVLGGSEKIIVDVGIGFHWPELKKKIEADGLDPAEFKMALFTHCHPDHMEAGRFLHSEYGLPLALSGIEADFFRSRGACFYENLNLTVPDFPLVELDEGPLGLAGPGIRLYLTPGHSPGGLSLHWPERKLLIVGDTYFPGTIGAIDYPGGSGAAMYASVALLEGLDGVETVLCGHFGALVGRDRILANYDLLNAEIKEKKAAGIF